METELLIKIQHPLMEWFEENARDLPWREKSSGKASCRDRAYDVWVSEIMLQQTRVEAVRPYYARFMEALPDVASLADCPEDQLLKLWEGLGYYSRVRNMQKAAKIVMEQYGGRIPESYDELLTLPGIGSYTAGAIASIAYGQAVPAVDGNVLRVISRITENAEDISRQAVKKKMEAELLSVMPKDRPGTFNQALMELGALVCVPNGYPVCECCPVGCLCRAREHGRQTEFPVKAMKKPRRIEERTVLVIRDSHHAAICRRPSKGLLAGLYELPNYEGRLTEDEAFAQVARSGFSPIRILSLPEARHIFSHVEWQMIGYLVIVEEESARHGQEKGASSSEAEQRTEMEAPPRFARRKDSSSIGRNTACLDDATDEPPASILFIEPERIRRDYPIPSAFAAYAKLLDEDVDKG